VAKRSQKSHRPPPSKDEKDPGYGLVFQAFMDCGGVIFFIF